MQNFFKKYGYGILLGLVVLLGVLLRLKGLSDNPSLWHDECALGWNIKFKNYGDFFGILRFMQMAPPFFMIITKLITNVLGVSDFSLRLLPFLVGSGSIIAFYFLANKTLNSKAVELWAVFFFAINQRLINYSFEFKPYGLDVLFAIICLLFFINLDLNKLNIKKAFLYGILFSVVPWFSFTSVFIIAGWIINTLFKIIKNREKTYFLPFTFYLLPLFISGLIYLVIYLVNNYTGTYMVDYWQGSFLNFNPIFFMYLLTYNIRYFFFPTPFLLFALILFLWGIWLFYKEKSVFVEIFSSSFILLVIASLLHIYPFTSRLILFLLPMFLLLIIKPFDLISFDKKLKSLFLIIIALLTFCPQIIAINYFVHIKTLTRREYPREMMDYLTKNIKPQDVIFVNSSSDTEFAYYSSFYNIKNNIVQERVTKEPKEKYFSFLNSLPKGYYWFYLPYDSSRKPVFQHISIWIKNQKILYFYQKDKSVLMYVYVE